MPQNKQKPRINLLTLALICDSMNSNIFECETKQMEITKKDKKTFLKIEYLVKISTYQTQEKLNHFAWQLFLIFSKISKNFRKNHFFLIEDQFKEINFQIIENK